ncbi:hypothetical protein LTT66_30585 [Nocardia gipuzkoensis]|uniref:hypothetical protein n=1 Tax=Nocardia gipuzkoensis TaxID=2749991 RepID=UPI001E2AF39D|nr:hypothetical protein [Nocardia gipuzkoensis]UGT67516.1 hypothetical protein LTT66_30585 [Nocardia gipuzkoensis]
MEPVTLVAAAVAAGASAGLSETAKEAVSDAYATLKNWITTRYRDVDVDVVEKQPESTARQAVLAEELQQAGAGADHELLVLARRLLELVQQSVPETVVGVQLLHTHAEGDVDVDNVSSTGHGVVADDTRVRSLRISRVQAGVQPSHPPVAR